jgi:hypothetical protein
MKVRKASIQLGERQSCPKNGMSLLNHARKPG